MNVKEIIINVAQILEMNDLYNYLIDSSMEITDSIKKDLDKMILAINMTNNTIASEYIELKDLSIVEVSSNFVSYDSITDRNIIEIKNVYNDCGGIIEYKQLSNGLYVESNKIKVEYSYFPKTVSLNDKIDVAIKLNNLTFTQGVVSEYLFLKGDFQESYVWDTKFKQSLSSIVRIKKNINTPTKEWL